MARRPLPPWPRRVDLRLILLLAAALAALAASLRPEVARERTTAEVMLVIDITGSMNARDYTLDGAPASRLAMLRATVPDAIAGLACGSRVGLSIFTERRSFVLVMPVEVCANYGVLAAAIGALDWRMAWEGDSRIAEGVFHALTLAAGRGYDVVFLTDGQEAPPLPWTGGPRFEGAAGAVGGLLVGVGGTAPVQIPKFDDRGRETGFFTAAEIPQESRTGAPPPGAETRPGFHPRNNPYGEMPAGTEHLTEVREAYLAALGQSLGLGYARLADAAGLTAAIERFARPHPVVAPTDVAALVGGFALLAAAGAFLVRRGGSFPAPLQKDRLVLKPVTLAASLALLLTALPAAAHGPTPQKVEAGIDIASPCELVWSRLRDFGSIGSWHPGVKAVAATGASARGATRTLTMPNGETVVEKLDEVDGNAQTLSYRLSKENLKALPVSFYTAKMLITRPDPGPSCRVDWEGRFYRGDTTNEPPPELNDEAAVKAMTDFFEVGLKGLKAAME